MGLIYYALVIFIYVTPLLYGGTSKLNTAITAIVIGCLTVLQALLCRNAATPELYRKFSLCVFAFGFCILIGILQCIPGIAFGHAAESYAEASLALHQTVTPYLSVSPEDTLFGVIKLLSYGAVFWLGLNAGADYKRAMRLFKIMALIGGLYSIGALCQHVTLVEKAAQLNTSFQAPDNVLTMVRNHFAVFMGIHMVIACALLWQSIESFRNHSWAGTKIAGLNHLLRRILPFLVLLPFLGISLVLTASRGGIACSFAGIIIFCLLLSISQSHARLWPVVFSGIVILLLVGLFSMGGMEASERYAQTAPEMARRLSVQRDTLDTIAFFPFTGSGLSTFAQIIKPYVSESFLALHNGYIVFEHAFNSYEETMLTLGIPGFLLLMAALLRVQLYCLRGVFIRKRRKALPAAAVAIGAIMALHSFVDYSMQIPTIALLVCLTLGIGSARAFPSESSQ